MSKPKKESKDLSKYAKDKGKQPQTVAEIEEQADQSALEYLQTQLSENDLKARIAFTVEEFGGIISQEGAMHVIARELGWTPPATRRKTPQELPVMSKKFLEEKASVVTEKEIEKPDGTKEKTTFYGTFGSCIAAVSSVSELLTSSPGDNYIAVELVGEDIQGVPLFLWREKAVNERYIRPHTGKLMIFRSVLIKHDDYNASGYRLTAAGKYFGVEPYEKGE